VALQNATGTSVSTISYGGTYYAVATVMDSAGAPVTTPTLVTFTLSSTLANLVTTTAVTGTTADGVAKVGITPSAATSVGAATITAVAKVDGNDVTSTPVAFGLSPANISLSSITAGSTSLVSGGNTSLSLKASIDGKTAAAPVNVTFSAACGSINGANGSSGVTTDGAGLAQATYNAVDSAGNPCAGSVTVTASSVGAVSQSTLLTIASPAASAVIFTTATLNQIYIQGTGAPTDSFLTFKVLNGSGGAIQNTPVTFSVPINPGGTLLPYGGVTLNGTLLAAAQGTTDSAGLVTVKVTAGVTPGPLKVRATIAGGAYSESQNLTVASGPPSQRYMSVSESSFNVEGQDIDGTSTTITVRLADRQGNPVQDGTVVNFTASGGQVASSCATAKINGIAQCSVLWQSQNPRPANGRVAVLAYTLGTKDYIDVDGSNTYTAGDTLVQLGDVYRDDNESGTYDSNGDGFFLSLGGTIACATAGEPAPSTGLCDSSLTTVVRQQVIILNSSSSPQPLSVGNGNLNTSSSPAGFSFILRSAGNPLLPMPVGTTVAAAFASGSANCSVTSVTPSTVGNISPQRVTNSVYPDLTTIHSVNLKTCLAGDQITVTVTPPSGAGSAYTTIISLP
jgi:hypothetical protein